MVLVLSHVEKGNVVTSQVLCTEITFDMLKKCLQRFFDDRKSAIKLSGNEMQIIMLIYSGVDLDLIENIIGISTDELTNYYDLLVDSGLARVVKVRTDIELTPRGISMIY